MNVLALAFALIAAQSAQPDKAALKALLRLPEMPPAIGLNLQAWRADQAMRRIAAMQGELVEKSDDPMVLSQAGHYFREAEQDDLALEYYGRAVTAFEKSGPPPNQREAYWKALIQTGYTEKAGKAIEEALKETPKQASLLALQAEIDYRAASERFFQRHSDLQALKAAAEEASPLFAAATTKARQASELSPKPANLQLLADILMANGLLRLTLKDARLATEDPLPLLKEAAEIHGKIVKLLPNDALAVAEHLVSQISIEGPKADGLSQGSLQVIESSAKLLEPLAKQQGSNQAPLAMELLAVIANLKGKPVEQLTWIEQAHKAAPTNLRLAELYLDALLDNAKLQEAVTLADILVDTRADLPLKMKLARLYEKTGSWDKAVAIIEELAKTTKRPLAILGLTIVELKKEVPDFRIVEKHIRDAQSGFVVDSAYFATDLVFTEAIYLAILGDTAGARSKVKAVERVEKSERVKKALELLGS